MLSAHNKQLIKSAEKYVVAAIDNVIGQSRPDTLKVANWECGTCGELFVNSFRLLVHFRRRHLMATAYVKCCGLRFYEEDLLLEHLIEHRSIPKTTLFSYCQES